MSVKTMGMGVVAAVLAASLAACGQSQQPSDAVSSGSISAQPDATNVKQASAPNADVANATLTVQPATIDGCKPSQPIVATVSWHSSSPKVKVMVSGPGQAVPGLFAESGYTGSAKTENWVIANTKFELLDEASGRILAQRIVTATPCK